MTNFKHLTQEHLEMLGIYYSGNAAYPRQYFVPCLGNVNLYEDLKATDLIEMIWKSGREYGQKEGKALKVLEIKKVLDIEQ